MAKNAKAAAKKAPKKDGGKKAAKDKAKKVARATKGTKPVSAKKRVAKAPQSGEKVRKVWGGEELRTFAGQIIIAQDRASKASGSVGQLISAKVKEKGLNGVAFRLAIRVLKVAERDPNAGRVLYDDILFLFDELEIDKKCGPSLFDDRAGAQYTGEDDEDTADGGGESVEPPGDTVVTFPERAAAAG